MPELGRAERVCSLEIWGKKGFLIPFIPLGVAWLGAELGSRRALGIFWGKKREFLLRAMGCQVCACASTWAGLFAGKFAIFAGKTCWEFGVCRRDLTENEFWGTPRRILEKFWGKFAFFAPPPFFFQLQKGLEKLDLNSTGAFSRIQPHL